MQHVATPGFAHHRLHAYCVSLEMARQARSMSEGLLPASRRLAEQLELSSVKVPLLIAEGANRRSRPQKRQRFVAARGECGELAAACELAQHVGLVDPERALELELLADRVAGMLTKLIARYV